MSCTSLVAQWLRVRLPMQGTRVRSLVREDLTCRGATKPASHNYWAHAPRGRALQQEKPPQWEAHAPQRRLKAAKKKKRKQTNKKTQCVKKKKRISLSCTLPCYNTMPIIFLITVEESFFKHSDLLFLFKSQNHINIDFFLLRFNH